MAIAVLHKQKQFRYSLFGMAIAKREISNLKDSWEMLTIEKSCYHGTGCEKRKENYMHFCLSLDTG